MPTSGTTTSTLTAQQIANYAAEELGVISPDEQLTGEEMTLAVSRLNWMLKSWQAKGVNLWRETSGTVTFPADTATVSLSPFVIDVSEARLVQSSTFERPLTRWERGGYEAFPNKTQPGWPTGFYLNKQRAAVTMTLWPVPVEEATVLYSYSRVIEDVTDPTQEIDVPQMWLETVWMCLAARITGIFGVNSIDPNTAADVKGRAAELEQELLNNDRPSSIFMGPVYGRDYARYR